MDITNFNTIGEFLIKYREKYNLTLEQLSEKVMITRVFLVAVEKEYLKLSKPMQQKIIKQLQLPLNTFDHIK